MLKRKNCCLWPSGDGPYTFDCPNKRLSDKPYCGEHHRVAYIGVSAYSAGDLEGDAAYWQKKTADSDREETGSWIVDSGFDEDFNT